MVGIARGTRYELSMMRGQHAEEREELIGGKYLRKHSLRKKGLTSAP